MNVGQWPANDEGPPGRSLGGPDEYRSRTAWTFAAILLLSAVIIALHFHGMAGRVYGSGQESYAVEGPESAYAALEGKHVRGRVLVLFGNYPHFRTSADYQQVRKLTASNFIEFSAFNNLIRKIYYILSDDAWEGIMQQGVIGAIRKAPGMERGVYLFNLVGIPIIATTPTSLPRLTETVVVLINSRRFDEASVRGVLAEKGIRSDLILTYGGN